MYLSAIRRLNTGCRGGLWFTVSLKCKEQIHDEMFWYSSGTIFCDKKVANMQCCFGGKNWQINK